MIEILHGVERLMGVEGPVSLALGVFDGVHIGHQKVIETAVQRAHECGGKAIVVTFEPHPIQVLAPEKAPMRILATVEHKALLLEKLDVDVLLVAEFTPDFAKQSASDFFSLIHHPQLHSIAVGEDWKFGKGRDGDGSFLRRKGSELNVQIDLVPAVKVAGERASSTRIRQALRDGNIAAASEMLGRPYTVMGKVVTGRQLGRTIGFPTANIEVRGEQLPPSGVWAVRAHIDGSWRQGIANLGKRPTVEQENVQRLLEVFIFDWEGNLYGKDLQVEFGKFIRPEKKFNGVDELMAQITKDVEMVKQLES